MKKKLITLVGILALTAFLSATLPATSEAKKDCLIMSIVPAEDPKVMIERYTPMKNWLEKEMGMCIQLFVATDYTGVIEAMRAKKVDVAFFGPFSYVLANERAGAEAFAVGVDKKGNTTYQSYLVATPEAAQKLGISLPLEGEAGLKVLAEKLNDHRRAFTFTFTDIASTSGHAVPRYYMHKAGIEPDKVFRRVGFVGTHDAAALVVKNKIIDMASVYDEVYLSMLDRGRITADSVVIIWKSPPIVGEPIAYRRDLEENIKDALKKAFVRIPSDLTGSARLVGYKLTNDSEYKVMKDIKRVMDALK